MQRTLLSDEKLRTILRYSQTDAEGDFAELGVYRGGVTWLMAISHPERTVRAFDTFAGMPAEGSEIDWHQAGEFADCSDTIEFLSRIPNVRIHQGIFPATAVDARFALVHLDADLYASTLAGLEWFWPRMTSGGAIILDDWGWKFCRGVEGAVSEYLTGRDAIYAHHAEHQLVVIKP